MALEVLERAEVLEAVAREGRQRDEAHGLDLRVRALGERVDDGVDLRPRAHEHSAAVVAGGAEDRAGHAVEHDAEERHVEDREEEASVEDVVRGEMLALHDRVAEHDQRHLEQGGDDPREARPDGAVAVEPGEREEQDRDEARDRRVLLRLLEGLVELDVPEQERPDDGGGADGEQQGGHVEGAERPDARQTAGRLKPQERGAQHPLRRPDVLGGELCRRVARR